MINTSSIYSTYSLLAGSGKSKRSGRNPKVTSRTQKDKALKAAAKASKGPVKSDGHSTSGRLKRPSSARHNRVKGFQNHKTYSLKQIALYFKDLKRRLGGSDNSGSIATDLNPHKKTLQVTRKNGRHIIRTFEDNESGESINKKLSDMGL